MKNCLEFGEFCGIMYELMHYMEAKRLRDENTK